MGGVSRSDRLALIESALANGNADPNYPRWYWSCPAAHCCFEGDVEALALLDKYGCDLEQRIEWVLQPEPRFTLVHAAAFNGNRKVLEFLRPRVLPGTFRSTDAEGSTPLHTLLESSRDLDSARFLLAMGLDGFSKNNAGRTPLSMSIEDVPELAERLLETKSRFEYRWWGEDLYWYSFDGIVLPCTKEGRAMPVTDREGAQTTVEGLIVRHKRRELLNQPVMRALIDRKWVEFADAIYQRRVIQYVLMVVGTFIASAAPADTLGFYVGDALWFPAWAAFLVQGVNDLNNRGGLGAAWDKYFPAMTAASGAAAAAAESASAAADTAAESAAAGVAADEALEDTTSSDWKVRKILNAIDVGHLAFVPLVPLAKSLIDLGVLPASFATDIVPIAAALQISLSIRLLQYISLFKSLGPLLVTVVTMFQDIFGFLGLFSFILFGFTNGFYVTFEVCVCAQPLTLEERRLGLRMRHTRTRTDPWPNHRGMFNSSSTHPPTPFSPPPPLQPTLSQSTPTPSNPTHPLDGRGRH